MNIKSFSISSSNMSVTSHVLQILTVIVSLQILSTDARALRNLKSSSIGKSASTTTVVPTSVTPCTGLLCKISRSYIAKTTKVSGPSQQEPVLRRRKRGDVDVKIAEYIQWMAINGNRPSNCEDIACGLIEIINIENRRKRSENRSPVSVQGHNRS